ncbi:hypothetical protein SMU40_08975 [Streptococcus mutans 15VF2]|nr:hypothetical protein SMU33_08937 [Streptococcus mutans 11SSST2]EMB72037.1 hypothetical protein SMU40_08975 [Streptococcus mutans 15VF2]EMB75793.1 hypothetical protein SMU41_05445 [Streptococcus mutans 2VS1]EMB87020.1 hypothetical protein SMU56_06122 [Streptococcus mutans N29]EMB87771.1 hypothetical protein SMU57_09066 [Streptococcus mutans NMT4863]EMB93176.1 hypothetical protein SMU61_08535 [Streptococcus mutans G123]EMC07802.1 hypothetical protein SMU69_00911 [Streptococcus mutans NLML4]
MAYINKFEKGRHKSVLTFLLCKEFHLTQWLIEIVTYWLLSLNL